MENLDPAADGYVLQRLGIAETLVDATEEAVPGLASGRTTSEDGPTWRFEIREGVTSTTGTRSRPRPPRRRSTGPRTVRASSTRRP